MWFVLSAFAQTWTPPAGLQPDDVAAALGGCFPDVKDLIPAGERLRFLDAGFEARSLWVVASRSIAIPQERCPAVRALPNVTDGVIRCFSLPKGGFTCKPIPGPQAAEALVQASVAERRSALDRCVGAGKTPWGVRFTVGIDGMPTEIGLDVTGRIDDAVVDCLSNEVGSWKFGHLAREVPVRLLVGG